MSSESQIANSISGIEAANKRYADVRLQEKVKQLQQQLDEVYEYAKNLFQTLAPQCEPCDSLILLLTQIDNWCAGNQPAWKKQLKQQLVDKDKEIHEIRNKWHIDLNDKVRLEETIRSALAIKQLWLYPGSKSVTVQQRDEGSALYIMEARFEQALKAK